MPVELAESLVDAVGAKELELILKGERSIITSCGSGMTAGVLWLGLKLLGAKNVGLYDEVSLTCVSIRSHPGLSDRRHSLGLGMQPESRAL